MDTREPPPGRQVPLVTEPAGKRITMDPEGMGGLPCIGGKRVTVGAVVGQLATGRTVKQVLEHYPYLDRADVLAALAHAAAGNLKGLVSAADRSVRRSRASR